MASATAKSQAEASAATAFSYAQAAKGRSVPAASSITQASQNTSGTNTPSKEAASLTDTSPLIVNGTSHSDDVDKSVINNGISDGEYSKGAISSHEVDPTTVASTHSQDSPSSTPLPAMAPTSEKLDDGNDDAVAVVNPNASESSWEKLSQHSASADNLHDVNEGKKGKRNGKKTKNTEKDSDKDTDKEKEEIAEPEEVTQLVPAPIPTVNFWQQRREAQAAKSKTSPPSSQRPAIVESSQALNGNGTVKSSEGKRKGRDDVAERVNGSIGNREFSGANKGNRKYAEGGYRSKEDSNSRRPGARGSRSSEKEAQSPAQLPPPVEDAMSWPTPETALEEEKRKAHEKPEKDEKEDGVPSKRPKEKWVTVPYVPSVNFNTPLPTRGGRARGGSRGGRGGHATNGDRVSTSAHQNASPTTETKERGRDVAATGRANSIPPNNAKRPLNEAYIGNEPVKSTSTGAATIASSNLSEKPKTNATPLVARGDTAADPDERQAPAAAQRGAVSGGSDARHTRSDMTKPAMKPESQSTHDFHSQPRLSGEIRRSDSLRSSDQGGVSKENGGFINPRDRGDGRPERGRGGYRGRGGHGSFSNGQQYNPSPYSNGHASQAQTGFPLRHNSAPYSPPVQQNQYSNLYSPHSSRGNRGSGPRSQSIPNSAIYPRYPANSVPVQQQMPQVQTAGHMFDYNAMTPISGAYNPYVEQYSLLAMVTMQVEYYFSIDNLCKDVYLRKHMDSQGFVTLLFIGEFKRIKSLTQDMELLRIGCQESDIIDLIKGEDGVDRIRRREGWEKWVLAFDEREPSAKNHGPSFHHRIVQQPRPQNIVPHMVMPGQQAMSPQAFSPNGHEMGYHNYANAFAIGAHSNGTNAAAYHVDTPLSAAVPDFAPASLPLSAQIYHDVERMFPDQEIAGLTVVFKVRGRNTASMGQAVSYDGAVDEPEDEDYNSKGLSNGSTTSGTSNHAATPSDTGSKAKVSKLNGYSHNGASTITWTKGYSSQAPASPGASEEPYNVFRLNALHKRDTSPIGQTNEIMSLLYKFWAEFLGQNLNPTMYEEFRQLALEDAFQRNLSSGMMNLVSFYDAALNSKKQVIPEVLARHYVELVKSEDSKRERPAFTKLRLAWRNGALDMKSRKKIDNFVDPALREELER